MSIKVISDLKSRAASFEAKHRIVPKVMGQLQQSSLPRLLHLLKNLFQVAPQLLIIQLLSRVFSQALLMLSTTVFRLQQQFFPFVWECGASPT